MSVKSPAPFPPSPAQDGQGSGALLGRRAFMGGAFSGAMAAGMAGMAKPGWGEEAPHQPVRGGHFRFGVHDGSPSDSHDPATYLTRQSILLAHQFRSYLTLVEPDGSLGPDLALEWSSNSDASQWRFRLNPKARFHSGRKVLADDVIASMNHHRSEKSRSAAKSLLHAVTAIERHDDSTVVFSLESGNADLPWLMTDYHLAICPARVDGGIDWRSGDGSGPYRIEEGAFGAFWRLSRHEDWHLHGAWFDSIEMIILNSARARQTALVRGNVDAVSLLELKAHALFARDPNIVVENVKSGAAVTIPMHCDKAPFDDPDVRNALKLSIDRHAIIRNVMFGAATVGNDFHLSPAQPYWPNDIPQRAFDPDKARSLLRKAGQEGLSVSLSVAESVFVGAVDACLLYAGQAREAGIDIRVVREADEGYNANVWLKKPFCMVSWGARPTPDVIFTLAYRDGAPWNESHWRNARFNHLLLAARSELNEVRRAEIYHEMCRIARDDGGTIIPFFPNLVYARRANVARGASLAPNWTLDGARAPSRWWFAA